MFLVSGCAGFIGSHLTEALLEHGSTVIGVDCFNDNYSRREKLRNLERARSWDNFDFLPIDLARGDLRDLVSECEAIFHLAAEPGVQASWGERFELYLRNNVLATQRLLEAAKAWPEKRFVYASSSSIYGDAEKLPTPEELAPKPVSPYGMTKLAAEHLCQLYHASYGVEVVLLRYFSVYGPRQRPDMAFNIFCRAAIKGEPITVFGDGRQTRDFTFIGDVVAATRAAVGAPHATGGVYNVGGGSQVSLEKAIELIEQFAGRPLNVRYIGRPRGDVRDTGADTTRARTDLGFVPRVDFRDGLEVQFSWMLNIEHALSAQRSN
jgi:nucleoside-diphosphate-sugar epimerase